MLSNLRKKELRAQANPLRPIIQIGKEGLSYNLIKTTEDSLRAHELVKVSVLKTCAVDVNELAIELSVQTHCEIVQVIGRTIVLYKKNKEKNRR